MELVMKKTSAIIACCLGLVLLPRLPALAQDYPARPVHVIVALPAGTGADITARVVSERMGQILGQSFIIENRPGGGSSVGAAAAARSANDGYTLFIGSLANVISGAMNSTLSFNFQHDFAPVA